TAIRNFLSCPRRYFLSYLLRMDSEDRASAHFGRLVHDVLSRFHKEHPVLSEYSLEELWKDINALLSRIWDNEVESRFSGNRLQARSYLRLAGEILQAYLQGEHSRWDESRTCILAEKNFDFHFDEYSLRGRIDRVDICAPDGGNEIMDFKTSAYDKEGESAMKSKFLNMDDDPDYRPQDFQLPIYYLAGLSESDLDPQKLVIYQLRNRSRSSGTPFRRELDILPDEDTRSGKKDKFLTKADLESVKGDILRTLERMVSGLYLPEPRDDNVCERECDFSFICDKGEEDDRQD
ncbi:RecB family exonuclease, partial [Candidatus Poribacteria bacterium]